MADLPGSEFSPGGAAQTLCLSRFSADAQSRFVLASGDALARPVQCQIRRLAVDLTSTYFKITAADVPEGDKRSHGYSRDKRPDCPQVVIALVVTPEGLPLAYEVLPGNTADCKTLRLFLDKIEQQYGRARRVWVTDRGIPAEAVIAEMQCHPGDDLPQA
jgi:transposase